MSRAVAVIAVLCLAACAQTEPRPQADMAAEAQRLAHRFLIVDTHIDVPYRLVEDPADVSQATATGDFDYPRAVAGGLDALFMSIYIPAAVDEAGGARALADELIDGVETLAQEHPDKFALATCTTDVLDAKARGLVAMPMGMENGGPLEGSLANLDHFRERGIRYITLAHSKSNHISDSSYDDNERWGGLSPFGKRLIGAMNERGVLVDVSHLSDAAFWQVIELSETPVIASHSSLRYFTPGFQRNMSDDMVRALGENGGVIQINFGSSFLTAEARAYSDAEQDREEHPYPYATLEDVLDHVDRAVKLAGIDHVGLGSDYDGVGDSLPVGLKDVSSYPKLVAGLLRRGYDAAAIEKILGGNIMRVWHAAELHAASAGYPPLCGR